MRKNYKSVVIMSKKERLPDGISAKMEGWKRFCRKYAELEVYGYDSKTGAYEKGSIAEQFNAILICVENILSR